MIAPLVKDLDIDTTLESSGLSRSWRKNSLFFKSKRL